jgi:hypothetical protein
MENIEIKFQYTKPYFLLAELLMLFSFKEMSVRRIMADVNKEGRGLETIGFFKLPGIKGWLVEPNAFEKHLNSLMIIQPRYDYEFTQQNEIKSGLKVVANNNQKLKEGRSI